MGSSNTGAKDDSDTEFSDPKTDSVVFVEGEKVLAFHGPCLYEAKVKKAELSTEVHRYYVHYLGWNKIWDEWVGMYRLLKYTEENQRKQKLLSRKQGVEKIPKSGRSTLSKPKSSTADMSGGKSSTSAQLPYDKQSIKLPSDKPSGSEVPDHAAGVKVKSLKRNPKRIVKGGIVEPEDQLLDKDASNPSKELTKSIPATKQSQPEKAQQDKKRKLVHSTVSKSGDIIKNPKKKSTPWVPIFRNPIPIDASSGSRTIAASVITSCILPQDVTMYEKQPSRDLFTVGCRSLQQLAASLSVLEDRRIRDEKVVKDAEEILKQHSLLTQRVKDLESSMAVVEEKANSLEKLVAEKDEVIDKTKKEAEESSRLVEDLLKNEKEIREKHIKELDSTLVFFTREDWKIMKAEYEIPDSDDEEENPQSVDVNIADDAAEDIITSKVVAEKTAEESVD